MPIQLILLKSSTQHWLDQDVLYNFHSKLTETGGASICMWRCIRYRQRGIPVPVIRTGLDWFIRSDCVNSCAAVDKISTDTVHHAFSTRQLKYLYISVNGTWCCSAYVQSQLCAGIFVSLVTRNTEQDVDPLNCHTVQATCTINKWQAFIILLIGHWFLFINESSQHE